jgi:hypothetical protein
MDGYAKGFVLTLLMCFSLAVCFPCPDQAAESVRHSAMMLDVDDKNILAVLNDSPGVRT